MLIEILLWFSYFSISNFDFFCFSYNLQHPAF